ncbi:MAG: PAS domain S-box protein, partial [Anaeromyxobacteraceae bacterium]
MATERAIVRWVTLAATAVAVGTLTLPPAAWFLLSYERTRGTLEAEAELIGSAVTQVVSADPDLWEFETVRLGEHLSRRTRSNVAERRQILNGSGVVVAGASPPLSPPVMTRSVPLLDAGVPVGSVELSRSLRPLLVRAILLMLLLAAPAALAFHLLRNLPLRALRRSRSELRHQRDAAQQYLDVAGVAFVILDAGGQVSLVNRKGEELLGREAAAVVGRDWMADFVDPRDRAHVLAELAAARPGDVVTLEFSVSRPAGTRRIARWYATPLAAEPEAGRPGLLLSGVDITRQRELEEQLAQTRKLKAVGQLAGGVAHDFNNILSSIKGYASVLRADLDLGSPHRLDAEEILAAVDRATALTRSLLTFSRRQDRKVEPVDLVEILRRSERLLRRQLPEDVVLDLVLPSEPLLVTADPAQLEQVLSNLVANARDAIPGAGKIVLSAAAATLDDDGAARAGVAAPGA